ncbi:MAG: hypothetical protein ACI4HI_10795, partial [Lachnospiraceae bacterium]
MKMRIVNGMVSSKGAEIRLSDGTVVRSDDSIKKMKSGSDLEKVKWVMTTKEGKVPAFYREETDRNQIRIQSRASHPETLEIRAISLADDTIQSEPYEIYYDFCESICKLQIPEENRDS